MSNLLMILLGVCDGLRTGRDFLWRLLYWHIKEDGTTRLSYDWPRRTGRLWIVKTDDEWAFDLGVSARKVSDIKKDLREKGILHTETHKSALHAASTVTHYKLQFGALLQHVAGALRDRTVTYACPTGEPEVGHKEIALLLHDLYPLADLLDLPDKALADSLTHRYQWMQRDLGQHPGSAVVIPNGDKEDRGRWKTTQEELDAFQRYAEPFLQYPRTGTADEETQTVRSATAPSPASGTQDLRGEERTEEHTEERTNGGAITQRVTSQRATYKYSSTGDSEESASVEDSATGRDKTHPAPDAQGQSEPPASLPASRNPSSSVVDAEAERAAPGTRRPTSTDTADETRSATPTTSQRGSPPAGTYAVRLVLVYCFASNLDRELARLRDSAKVTTSQNPNDTRSYLRRVVYDAWRVVTNQRPDQLPPDALRPVFDALADERGEQAAARMMLTAAASACGRIRVEEVDDVIARLKTVDQAELEEIRSLQWPGTSGRSGSEELLVALTNICDRVNHKNLPYQLASVCGLDTSDDEIATELHQLCGAISKRVRDDYGWDRTPFVEGLVAAGWAGGVMKAFIHGLIEHLPDAPASRVRKLVFRIRLKNCLLQPPLFDQSIQQRSPKRH